MKPVFYLCACSDEPRGGIYTFHLSSSANLSEAGFQALPGSNYLCFSPERNFLYATLNDEGHAGGAAVYRLDGNGIPVFLNKAYSCGRAACHITCSPDGAFLYCANYLDGNFAEFALNGDGSIGAMTHLVQHTGSGPRKDRQESAHTHCTVFTPDGKYLCVCDLGTDSVMIYPYRSGEGIVPEDRRVWKAEPGEGPRHLLFDRSGRFAFLINELGNSVTTLACGDGTFRRLDCVSTLPEKCSVKTKAAALRFSPDGRYLYATNRGFDSIACFRVTETGKLEIFDIVSSFGTSPRDISFLPGGKFFAAANEFSDAVCFYEADALSGKLKYLEGRDLRTLPRPICFLY